MSIAVKNRQQIKLKTNANALVETLSEIGVDSIFGYPGAAVLSIYNELSFSPNITHYLVRHEQAAIHAAEGYARAGGKIGTVLVTSGPGFTNTITGIVNAYTDSTPLVILAGDVPTTAKNDKVFQNVDIISMTQSCTKKTFLLTEKDDIKAVIKEAYCIADSGIKGPVVIALPRNILEAEYCADSRKNKNNECEITTFKTEITRLKELISNSQKPLIIVGGGAIDASEEIIKFVMQYNFPVVSTLMGIGVFPSDKELYLGMIGLNGTYAANTVFAECDLLISFGVAFSDRSTCKKDEYNNNKKIVSINLKSVSKDFELEIQADVKEFLSQLLAYDSLHNPLHTTDNKNNIPKNWLEKIKEIKNKFVANENSTQCLHSSYVLATLSEYTNKYKPIVVTDVGQHQMLTAQFYNFNQPRKFITSGGLGTMGFGLPAAIGAQIANPDNLILNITGDGSFQMNLQELATCREHNIPVKVIIMNNGYLGMVRQLQEKIYNNRYQVEMTNPDFVKIAEAYDLFAIRVSDKDELIPAINKAIEYNGTAIVDIMIDSFEEI